MTLTSLTHGGAYYVWVAAANVEGIGGTVTAATWSDPDVQWPLRSGFGPQSFAAQVLLVRQGDFPCSSPSRLGMAKAGRTAREGPEILAGGRGNAFTTVLVVDAGVTNVTMTADVLGCGVGLTLEAVALDTWGDPGRASVPVNLEPTLRH